MKLAADAVFVSVNTGAFTGVVVVLVQRAAAGQVGSPPPLTVAVFTAGEPLPRSASPESRSSCVPPTARPAGTVQVTV